MLQGPRHPGCVCGLSPVWLHGTVSPVGGRRNECVVYFVFASYSVWAVLPRVRSVPALCLSSRCPVPSTLVREEQNGHATWSPLFIPAIACDERFWAGGGHLLFERGELPWLVCWDFLIRRVALLDAAQFSWWHHRLIVSLHTRMAGQQGSSVASGRICWGGTVLHSLQARPWPHTCLRAGLRHRVTPRQPHCSALFRCLLPCWAGRCFSWTCSLRELACKRRACCSLADGSVLALWMC